MKQLTQAIFDGQSEEWKYAAVNKNGSVWLYQVKPSVSWSDPTRFCTNKIGIIIESGYNTNDWQNSAIDREVSK